MRVEHFCKQDPQDWHWEPRKWGTHNQWPPAKSDLYSMTTWDSACTGYEFGVRWWNSLCKDLYEDANSTLTVPPFWLLYWLLLPSVAEIPKAGSKRTKEGPWLKVLFHWNGIALISSLAPSQENWFVRGEVTLNIKSPGRGLWSPEEAEQDITWQRELKVIKGQELLFFFRALFLQLRMKERQPSI